MQCSVAPAVARLVPRRTHLCDGDVRRLGEHLDAGIAHEVQEGQDEVGSLADDVVRLAAVPLEAAVVRRLGAAHCVDHLLRKAHRGREGLGVAAEDVTEVCTE